MKLRVTLRRPGIAESRNLQIIADATATPRDVAVSLAEALGQQGDHSALTLRVADAVTGQVRALDPASTLIDSGLTSGSTIELGYAEARRGADRGSAVAILRVTAGADEGLEVQLAAGSSDVGRDPSCDVRLSDARVSRHHARINISDRIEVVDNNSANGLVVGGVRQSRVSLAPGDVVTVGDTLFSVVHLRQQSDSTSTDIAFVRSPRVLARPRSTEVEFPEPPTPPERGRFPWIALVAPLVMGAVMYAVTRNLLSIVFVGLSPILMVGTWLTTRLDSRSQQRRAIDAFHANLDAVRQRVTRLHREEVDQLLALHPSVADCVSAVSSLSDLVWSRRPEHPEFGRLRLGLGEGPASIVPRLNTSRGLPDLAREVTDAASASLVLGGAPVVADLREVGSVGVCGRGGSTDGVARALVTQLVTLHSPSELVLCCLTSSARKPVWSWTEWLPHANSPHSPLPAGHLAADAGVSRRVLDHLEELVDARSGDQAKHLDRGPISGDEQLPPPVVPTLVVIVDDPQADRARLTRLAEVGPDVGVHLLWVAERQAQLPAGCRTFLDLSDGATPLVGQVRVGSSVRPVACESVDETTAEAVARRFAPLVDAGAPIEDDSDLPQSISVVSLLGPAQVDQADAVLERWRENRSLVSRDGRPVEPVDRPADLRAVVGHDGSGPFVIDLRRDGPHALVGGTTGAGKSEFLQAWVLGLAHALSPDRVNFLFVDYKGGSAFSTCLDLPHTVGLVTDLTPYLVRRALTSLRAELRHREHLLNAKGKKDLIELERSGDPECPPSLVIVVDEFAALVTEVPDFVDGMVDVAQRGRSLGLHLVLATQRPAGVIKDNLRANTNLRIALRMADEQDSTDVLGTPMAAHFSPSIPGRGAAKTGPGRITPFQSAFPGARTPAEPPLPPIEVAELDFGAGTPWKMPDRRVVDRSLRTDIERVVSAIGLAAARGAVPPPRKPWLKELASVYNLVKLSPRRDTEIVLGVLDDPEHQRQVPEYYRPDGDGNILYIGTGGSGKTTALRSLAIAASITPRSGPVHIYGLDFGGGGLAPLAPLPNVGSIISGDDAERTSRLLRHLSAVVEERSSRFTGVSASTLEEYRRLAERPQEPRLLVLLDGFGAFRDQYETVPGAVNPYTMLSRLLVDGRAVGVHVAMTADRPSAVPTSVASAFSRRVILRQADEEAYALLGLPRDVLGPTSPAGRAMQADNPQELQLAILGDEVTTAAQARRIEALAASIAEYHPTRPPRIQALTSLIPAASMPEAVGNLPVLGVDDLDLRPVGFDPEGMVLISGPAQSGRTSALHWFAQAIRRSRRPVQLHHLSPRRSPLSGLGLWQSTAVGEAAMLEVIARLKPLADTPAGEGHPTLGLFVEAMTDLVSTQVEYPLTDLLQACRRNGHLVVAEGELSGWASSWPLLSEVRNSRTGLLLQPEQLDGDTVLRTSLPRVRRADFPPGRGFWIKSGIARKVQIPLPD